MLYDIQCPRCRARAHWDEAFEFLSASAHAADNARPVHRWGNWHILEKYPAVFPWRAPQGRRYHHVVRGEFGVTRCTRCHHVAPHPLCWPRDAFFQWKVRDVVLWAEHAAHAQVLLHYIGSALRDPHRYGPSYVRGLQRLPAPVLASRNRASVVKQIGATLRAEGLSTDAPPHTHQ